jgi:hypothetical protein
MGGSINIRQTIEGGRLCRRYVTHKSLLSPSLIFGIRSQVHRVKYFPDELRHRKFLDGLDLGTKVDPDVID